MHVSRDSLPLHPRLEKTLCGFSSSKRCQQWMHWFVSLSSGYLVWMYASDHTQREKETERDESILIR